MIEQVLIVEDVGATRDWLAEVVRQAFAECQIYETRCVHEGRIAVAETTFDLALIDLGLPDGSGLDVLRHLRATCPATICVITTAVGDDAHIVAALSAGAHGYLLKEQSAELLSRQLVHVVAGIPALSPKIAQRIMQHFQRTGPASECDGKLTQREKEILALLARGYRNADTANQLGIAESTVASHIKAIYRKLGISSRAEASWHATQLGL